MRTNRINWSGNEYHWCGPFFLFLKKEERKYNYKMLLQSIVGYECVSVNFFYFFLSFVYSLLWLGIRRHCYHSFQKLLRFVILRCGDFIMYIVVLNIRTPSTNCVTYDIHYVNSATFECKYMDRKEIEREWASDREQENEIKTAKHLSKYKRVSWIFFMEDLLFWLFKICSISRNMQRDERGKKHTKMHSHC